MRDLYLIWHFFKNRQLLRIAKNMQPNSDRVQLTVEHR